MRPWRQTGLVTGHTVVASANVLFTLRDDEAAEALHAILDREPDLVGLQEWGVSRYPLLSETGWLRLPFLRGVRLRRSGGGGAAGYVWAVPLLGGCPVGARGDRFELLECHVRILGWFGRADRSAGPPSIAVPRVITIAVFRDQRSDRVLTVLNFHLSPRVQASGRYRQDRPRLVARHQAEVRNLSQLVAEQLARGRVVYAVGDSNFDGLRLPGLTSAWEGRGSEPGTLGSHRKIDDVHGPGPSTTVALLTNASDHKAVVVTRADIP